MVKEKLVGNTYTKWCSEVVIQRFLQTFFFVEIVYNAFKTLTKSAGFLYLKIKKNVNVKIKKKIPR